jgi:hypothetical protein
MKRNPTQAQKGGPTSSLLSLVGVTLRAKGPLAAATVAAYVGYTSGASQVNQRPEPMFNGFNVT